jgi:hypothetical protein
MNGPDLSCQEENRREDVRAASLFGLDYIEVGSVETGDDQRTLFVHFLGRAPETFELVNLQLTGGSRIREVQITDLRVIRQKDLTLDDYLEVEVNKSGDFSPYTLSAVEVDDRGRPTGKPMAGFDKRYSKVTFSFKASCPSDLDCKLPCSCPPPQRTGPDINYLAKDYASFKQLMLDRLSLIMPEWSENHAPDIGLTLVELLAYAGDYLSYYQDAVATEAYLGTARERISVRRHARLVDYAMHEGCNARTWLTLWTSDKVPLDPAQIYFITSFANAPQNQVLTDTDLENVPSSSYEIFEPLLPRTCASGESQTITIYPEHNQISFYTWGDCRCCLPPGTTCATLVDNWIALPPPPDENPNPNQADPQQPGKPATNQPAATKPAQLKGKASAKVSTATTSASAVQKKTYTKDTAPAAATEDTPPGTERALKLKVGDVLILEEIKGAKNGNPNDADPRHRQAVRLTRITPAIDPLYHPYANTFGAQYGQPVLEIEWASEDALTFPLCISSQAPPPKCDCMTDVSVARGNVILVDHGGDVSEPLGNVPTQSSVEKCPSCCHPAETQVDPGLYRPALTQQPLTFSEPLPPPCSAAEDMDQDPRQALPCISLVSIPPAPDCSNAPAITAVTPASSLLDLEAADNTPPPRPPCVIDPLFTFDDLADPTALAKRLKSTTPDPATSFLLAQLSPTIVPLLQAWDGASTIPDNLRAALLGDLNGMLETWSPLTDLLESGPDDRVFVAEIDNQGYAHLRFGNGILGRRPEAGTAFRADYRVDNGRAGNVGAQTISYIVFRRSKLTGVTIKPRNPFAAMGGQDPEPIADVKQFAPYAFRAELQRAVTADDYSTIAEDNTRRWKERAALERSIAGICMQPFRKLQRAKCALRWNGSWYTAQVALDPEDSEAPDVSLIDEITGYLEPFRRMGHDLLVKPAQYVPLTVTVTVCVLPDYLRGHVESAVLDALSNRRLPDGRLGFFHPDNLSFGDGIYVSRLLATVQAVPGVMDVTVNELERFEISEPDVDIEGEEVPANSVLELGPMEIARLDNDPNFPENGRLVVNMRGGR